MYLLVLLFVKHWVVDFVAQTEEEIKYKGVFGDWRGIKHSLKHGALTAVIAFMVVDPVFALLVGLTDFVVHYLVDWTKMNYGERDMKNPKFWRDLGLDQLAHALTYVFIFNLLLEHV